MRLTKRQKEIASCACPTVGGFATKNEVKQVKKIVRGHYWDLPDFIEYCAYSPGGKRKYFEYSLYWPAPKSLEEYWKKLACKAAKLWAEGKCKESEAVYEKCWDARLWRTKT